MVQQEHEMARSVQGLRGDRQGADPYSLIGETAEQDECTPWTADTMDVGAARFVLSVSAQEEIRAFARRHRDEAADTLSPSKDGLAALAADVEALRPQLDGGDRLAFVQPVPGLDRHGVAVQTWVLSSLLGTPQIQSSLGQRMVAVWDRDPTRSMRDGARYHQSHEGGGAHTDNVNVPERWHYLLFGSVAPAAVGGASVLVCAHSVLAHLEATVPEAVRILRQDFWWEYRGLGDDIFRAPVLRSDAHGQPLFRYLRAYLESAHRKAGQPLSARQLWALDALDATLELPELRLTYTLAAGEIVILNDAQVFHGRATFCDSLDAVSLDEHRAGASGPLKRTLMRTWVKRTER